MKRLLNQTDIGRKVRVYYNLHRHCWSVQDATTRRVIGHCDRLTLSDCVFRVSESGRQRVLREQRKNVHAAVTGVLKSFDCFTPVDVLDKQITYNPYKFKTFVLAQNVNVPITNVANVAMFSKQVWSIKPQ